MSLNVKVTLIDVQITPLLLYICLSLQQYCHEWQIIKLLFFVKD